MADVKEEYIRVGTSLYKLAHQPLANGTTVLRRIPWSFGTIRQDYGKSHTPPIKKYDGFCTVPSHTDYHKEIDGFYNLYEPITHVPVEGEFPDIIKLMRHIFGEQFELGLDYMQLLYRQPTQKLPILLLVSEERNTGKTTFLNFLKAVFQDNTTFNTNEDFRSQFNADWAGKLLIVVDEVLLCRREDSERLKNLSTAQTYKVEAKGKDRQEVNFFAKFVLCSNNELFPVIIDMGETRYWVRKVMRLDSDDTNFLQKLKEQIPAFLYYLQHRPLATTKESRMWFDPALIRTEALERIMQSNRNHTEIDIVELLRTIMESQNVDKISFIPQDLLPLLSLNGVKVELWHIRKVVKELWRLKPAPNALSYTTYQYDYSKQSKYGAINRVGRFYTVTKEFLDTLNI
ncbi:primase-helicase family protein [Prevotella sp.]|uniref:primase-helicase family protein n=1 Tax=Prevotella sp. TaxID=59823 RepID=UPI0025E235EF|nr:primase-helicase family protein [Prevotella sp.]